MTRKSFRRWEKSFSTHNWTVEEMEMLINMNIVGRPEVMFIKAMEIGRGGCCSKHETIHVARPEPQGRAATMQTLFTW